jgi:hypothetical protein
MKNKKLLISAFIMLVGVSVMAQDDITPLRYVFANQPVGQYKLDAANAGANPPAGWALVTTNYTDGLVVLAAGPAIATSLTAPQVAGLQTGLNIVDMGGTVGKVLCLQGINSNYKVGTPMGSGYAGAWYNLNFYFDKTKSPVVADLVTGGMTPAEALIKATMRVRIVFSVAENVIRAGASQLNKFYTSNFQNNTSPALADVPQIFPSDAFQATDTNGDPLPNGNGEAYYDPTKWMVYEFDCSIPETTGNPTRLKMEFDGPTTMTGTVLIKEIKITKNQTGSPVTRQIVRYTPGQTGIFVPKMTKEILLANVNGNKVTLLNLTQETNVSVFSVNGQLIKSLVANLSNNTFDLNSGMYIVKAANKVAKVAIK